MRHGKKANPVLIDKELTCLQQILGMLEHEIYALTPQDQQHELDINVAYIARVQQRIEILGDARKRIQMDVLADNNGPELKRSITKIISKAESDISHHVQYMDVLQQEEVVSRAIELNLLPIPKCIDHACAPVIHQFLTVHKLDADWSTI